MRFRLQGEQAATKSPVPPLSSIMYCGDETGSFVGEIGTRSSKFGYGGQDAPGLVTPSYVVLDGDGRAARPPAVPSCCYNRQWGERNVQTPMRTIEVPESVDPADFLAQGDCVQDWDAWEALWRHSFHVMRTKDNFKHTSPAACVTSNNNSNNKNSPRLVGSLKTDESSSTLDAVKPARSTLTTAGGGSIASSLPSHYNDSRVTHPILVVAPGYTHSVGSSRVDGEKRSQKQLVEMTERMMESLECGALFIAPTAMLAAFAHGRQTGTVVDIGASGCRVTPVVDGLLLYNAQRRNGRGGDWLGNVQYRALSGPQAQRQNDNGHGTVLLRSRYQVGIRNNNGATAVNPIFHRWAIQDLMYEMRTSGCMNLSPTTSPTVSTPLFHQDDNVMEVDSGGGEPAKHYELPDGTLVDLSTQTGKDLCRLPELLFADSTPFTDHGTTTVVHPVYGEHPTLSAAPLHQLVHEALSAVADIDVRKELASHIIVTGSVSLTPQLDRRLSHELAKLCKSRVIFNKHNVERQCAAWIGGSILTSLGSFQQLWLSRAEYDEYGAYLASQRFPLS
jgi:actin-related protein